MIEKGDIVDVYFTTSRALFKHKVLYIPQAIGDSWHLQDLETGKLVYVQLFEQMKVSSGKYE